MCNCENYFPPSKMFHPPPFTNHSTVHSLLFVWFSFTFTQKAFTFNVHYKNQDLTSPSANVCISSHWCLFLIRCRGSRLSKEKFNLNTITLKNSQAFRLTTRQERCDGNERKFFVKEKLNIIAENGNGDGDNFHYKLERKNIIDFPFSFCSLFAETKRYPVLGGWRRWRLRYMYITYARSMWVYGVIS